MKMLRSWQATTDNGAALLMLPTQLTTADIADLHEWIALIFRTLEREQARSPLPSAPPGDPGAQK
jgi:hypothetical protein